ncbi:MAG: ABC transporter ATP-binding protein [Bernardetiaceae bacterium]|nr:ABC transporter ATP-binding protein [Bernardetiaceae bacterium]
MKELSKLNPYIYRYKWHLLGGTLFVLLSSLFAIIPAQIVRYAFDLLGETIEVYRLHADFEAQGELYERFATTVLLYGSIIIGLALLRGVVLFFQRQTIIVMSRHIEYDLKNDIYLHYQSLPLSFYRKNNTGDLMARISEDVSHVRMYLGPAIMYSINTIGTFVLVIAYMLTINVKLTFFALLPLPVLSVSIYYVNNIINQRSTALQKSLSSLTTFVQESFSGIRVVKAFTREKDLSSKFLFEANTYKGRALDLVKVEALFFPLIVALIGLSTVLTVYVGGLEIMAGRITAGNIAEFIIYVNMLTWPVTSVGWVTSIIQRAAASQARINEFLDTPNHIVSVENQPATDIQGRIYFNDVSFVYPESGIEALQNISFEISPGETLAILGTTGSGKSTIANLISRMYEPTKGVIHIDEKPIEVYNVQSLRAQIAYVPQDVFLFSDSLRENVTFGMSEGSVSEAQVIQAVSDADLYQNILDFPRGLDTELGERGITLSGGQKQRLSIARAIVRNPKILVLDDCLSAVDTKTENKILNNMQRIMKGRTAIIISHRVSSAQLADKIIVLDDGKIVEEGKHEQLLQSNGIYKELYEKQLETEVKVS